MRISASKFYTVLFALALFSQIYLSSFRMVILFQLFLLSLFFLLEKPKISARFLNQLMPLLLIFGLGFVVFFFHNYKVFNLLKDIFHFIKPILGLLIGYFFYRKINDFRQFVKTIVICGFLCAIVHFIILFSSGNAFSGSLSGVREYTKDNYLELFAVFFLVYHKKFFHRPLFASRVNHYLVLAFLLPSCILYFSRTMIIVAVVLLLSLHGVTYITKRTLKVIGLFLLLIAAGYIYLFSIKIERKETGVEAFFYKVKNAPAELFTTRINRDDHRDLWDHWRGYEAKRAFALMKKQPSSFVVGTGQGSLVNLKFKAPLGTDGQGMKFISELHNGYVYMFYKTGAIGLFLLLFFLLSLYLQIYLNRKSNKFIQIMVSAIGLIFLFTTLTITGIYNVKDIMVFILGALLYFYEQDNKAIQTP